MILQGGSALNFLEGPLVKATTCSLPSYELDPGTSVVHLGFGFGLTAVTATSHHNVI